MRRRVSSAWELVLLQRQLDEVLADLAQPPEHAPSGWTPTVDVLNCPGRFIVRVDLPGVAAEAIEIVLSERELRISGSKPACGEGCPRRYHHMERGFGPFTVVISLPGAVDGERCSARLRAGVLEVALPHPLERRQVAHRIPVAEEEL